MTSTEKFIFLHLPKTGGTTLRTILEHQYGPNRVCGIYDGDDAFISQEQFGRLSKDELARYSAFCGHISFGIHDRVSGNPKYFALFRHPIDRIISYYHHAMTHAPGFRSHPVSLMKFLNRGDWQVDNLYVRLISGHKRDFGKCGSGMLFQAMNHIDQHFVTTGIQEHFDDSMKLLAEKMGWPLINHHPVNVSKGRPDRDYFSHQEIERIAQMNKLDIILYDYVKQRFDRDLAALKKTADETAAKASEA